MGIVLQCCQRKAPQRCGAFFVGTDAGFVSADALELGGGAWSVVHPTVPCTQLPLRQPLPTLPCADVLPARESNTDGRR